jgi:hypothetical protein
MESVLYHAREVGDLLLYNFHSLSGARFHYRVLRSPYSFHHDLAPKSNAARTDYQEIVAVHIPIKNIPGR